VSVSGDNGRQHPPQDSIQQNIFPEDILDHVRALNRENDPHWQAFVQFLDRRGTTLAVASCTMQEDIICRWIQGRSHELAGISWSIHSAEMSKKKFQEARDNKVRGGAAL